MEFLVQVPMLFSTGNHEIEQQSTGEIFPIRHDPLEGAACLRILSGFAVPLS